MGTDIGQLERAGRLALDQGLALWLQPRLADNSPERTVEYIGEAAAMAETLRRIYGDVTLNAGCEFTLLMGDIVPGTDPLDRINNIITGKATDFPAYSKRVAEVVSEAAAVARKSFQGQITYAAMAGEWDAINWAELDIVNLDLYLSKDTRATYVEPIRRFQPLGKPIVVGEFGCGCFDGAQDLGGMCWDIVDHYADPPYIQGEYKRNDQVQADYAKTCLDAIMAEGVDGAFWYQFIERGTPKTTDDPKFDVEIASYGVVTPFPGETDDTGAMRWEPKPAFHQLANIYARV
jgi:hypothetical protein